MGLMDSLRSMFSSGGKTEPRHEAVEYQGFLIRPAPQRQSSGWNTAGVISKEYCCCSAFGSVASCSSVQSGRAVESRAWLLSADRENFIEEAIKIIP